MSLITENFLLHSDVAVQLYHKHAAKQPIVDYHCHLPQQDVANNRRFQNLYEIWLEGDHYKWRAMRANGASEELVTGKAAPYDKFLAYVKTVPAALRNPLYHWSHLELKRYFDIDLPINEKNAQEIWRRANDKLKTDELSARGILKKMRVYVVCTTDDPTDDLADHIRIAKEGLPTKVYPTFRPDKALQVDVAADFNAWTDKLAQVSGTHIAGVKDFLDALKKRHDFFHSVGCRLSDHGLPHAYGEDCTDAEASAVFDKARSGKDATLWEKERFASYVMHFVGVIGAEKGWTMQLHLGPIRNNSTRKFRDLGRDVGGDSIGDDPQAQGLSRFLDKLDTIGKLGKTILYNINPRDNYLMATMIANFQDGVTPGKMQFGSGWWHLDQKEGMEWQINALSNLGLISRFVGMLTDSRSFLSYTRHEYFRRILCNMLGEDVRRGEVPNDMELLGNLVEDICFRNAKNYFGLEMGNW
jgi:glucuronate isomerase